MKISLIENFVLAEEMLNKVINNINYYDWVDVSGAFDKFYTMQKFFLNQKIIKSKRSPLNIIHNGKIAFLSKIDFDLDPYQALCIFPFSFTEEGTTTTFQIYLFDELQRNFILNVLEQIGTHNKLDLIANELKQLLEKNCNSAFFWYCWENILTSSDKAFLEEINDFRSYVKTCYERVVINLNKILKDKTSADAQNKFNKFVNDSSKIVDRLKEEILSDKYSDEIKDVLQRELNKLSYTSPSSPDYSSIIQYVNTVLSIPFDKYSGHEINPANLLDALNKNHYGLDNVKEAIMESISLQQWTKRSLGQVLCLIGPPGTGKSSIANVIAKELNREYIKIALGGLSDETEFRGFRRSYLNSEEGRLVKSYIKCQTMDPLVVLDEIDKLHVGRGSPADALLEILDPEQNDHFVDRYLGFPLDISRTLFVCTANYKEQIPAPLLDRMDIIDIEGYNFEEQLTIARDYLIPKYQANWNLKVSIEDDILRKLCVKKKTGVRDLERNIRSIMKKSCVQLMKNNLTEYNVNAANLADIKFAFEQRPLTKFGF